MTIRRGNEKKKSAVFEKKKVVKAGRPRLKTEKVCETETETETCLKCQERE